MSTKPFGLKLSTLALAAFVAAAVGPASFAAEKTIKIGALLPMSGPGSYFGAQDKQGIELALDALNATGVNGFKLEVVRRESKSCEPRSVLRKQAEQLLELARRTADLDIRRQL